jgi:hypothetical protein
MGQSYKSLQENPPQGGPSTSQQDAAYWEESRVALVLPRHDFRPQRRWDGSISYVLEEMLLGDSRRSVMGP